MGTPVVPLSVLRFPSKWQRRRARYRREAVGGWKGFTERRADLVKRSGDGAVVVAFAHTLHAGLPSGQDESMPFTGEVGVSEQCGDFSDKNAEVPCGWSACE